MDKVAHFNLYAEALEKIAKERKKSPLGHTLSTAKGALGGGIIGGGVGASGSIGLDELFHQLHKLRKKPGAPIFADKKLGRALSRMAHGGLGGAIGLLAGAGIGGRYGYKKYKDHFSKKEAYDQGYAAALAVLSK